MKIWTTNALAVLFFPDKKFPLEIGTPMYIQSSFLQNAVPGDMALIELPEDYMEFLVAAKAKGILGPFIFISPEPTVIDEQMKSYNAMVLYMKKTEISEIREVVNFIVRLASTRDRRAAAVQVPVSENVEFETFQRESPVTDPSIIKKVLESILRAGTPVIVSVGILEDGDLVTARGLCHVKALTGHEMVLYRLSPEAFSGVLKKNTQIKLVLSHLDENYEISSAVLTTGLDNLYIKIPDTLFIEKRGNVRVEPSRRKPVLLYMLRTNVPTNPLRVGDICLGGLSFETEIELAKDSIHGFTIVLPEQKGIVLSYGKIVYQRSAGLVYRYGVQLNIHPGDEERIADYIMHREKEISALLSRTGVYKR